MIYGWDMGTLPRCTTIACLVSVISGLTAESAPSQRAGVDEEGTRAIRSYTTRPEFLSPLVDPLPASIDGVPPPREVLGYTVGQPGKMTYYADIVRYMEALAEKSARVDSFFIGTSSEGRRIIALAVSSEENIRQIEKYKSMTAALADPRLTSEARSADIVREGKPIYAVMGAVQGAETASPEMMMELAYRLAVSDDPTLERIRHEVIVLILPVFEPDGRDRYADWYLRHLVDITDQTQWKPASPYWSKYLYHDTNRDGIVLSQPATRALLELFDSFHPQVIDDFHESLPFLYIFTGTGPNYPNYGPIYETELSWLAHYELAQMSRWGMPGVWVYDFAQAWYPGYVAWIAVNRNAASRFHQSFGNAGASTMRRELTEPILSIFNNTRTYANRLSREWFRPVPPYREVEWSHRNSINYQQTAVLSALDLVARHPETLLENFWKKSSNSLHRGRTEPPYAWVVPSGQGSVGHRDADARATSLVNLVRRHGIEVHRLTAEMTLASVVDTSGVDGGASVEAVGAGEARLPRGSYVVRMDQPYRNFIQTLFEIQKYPKNAPPSYDDTAWTLGLMYGVRTMEVRDQAILNAAMEPVVTEVPNGYTETKALKRRFEEAGSPRVGLVYTWRYTQDTGWLRFTLDTLGVRYELVNEERLRRGGLAKDFDALVFAPASPAGRGDGEAIVAGLDRKYGPLAYARTARFRFMGDYDSSEDITGGMGLVGVENLETFVRDGGTLVTIGSACRVPVDYGLVPDVAIVDPPGLLVPGSILSAEVVDDRRPTTDGYSRELAVFFAKAPVFSVMEGGSASVLLRFAENETWLSGLAGNAVPLRGAPAIIEAPIGRGKLVMFAFNPVHRWLSVGTFDLLFNTILAPPEAPHSR